MVAAACSTQGSRSADPVKAAAVQTQIDNRNFTIAVNRMIPNKVRSVNFTYPYDLRIKGDSVFSHLPYIGQGYTPLFGTQEGLVFNAPITDFKVAEGQRGSTEITFRTRSSEDRFDYRIVVFPNGASFIYISPDRRESISFQGEMRIEGD